MTHKEAVELAETGFWEDMSFKEIAMFQLWENKLCMPWNVFQEAIEKALGRPVFTHEFGVNRDGLKKELLKESEAPTLKEIIDLIPIDYRAIVVIGE